MIADTTPRAPTQRATSAPAFAAAEPREQRPEQGERRPAQRSAEGGLRRREGGNGQRPHGNGVPRQERRDQRPAEGQRSQPSTLAAAVQQDSNGAGEARRDGQRNNRNNGQRPGGEGRPFNQNRRGAERGGQPNQPGRPAASPGAARGKAGPDGKPFRFKKRNNGGQRFAGNRASTPA
jgi:hypothetical protein